MQVHASETEVAISTAFELRRSSERIEAERSFHNSRVVCQSPDRAKVIGTIEEIRRAVSLSESEELLAHGAAAVSLFAANKLLRAGHAASNCLDNLCPVTGRPVGEFRLISRTGISNLSADARIARGAQAS